MFGRLQEQGRLCKAVDGLTIEYLANLDGELVDRWLFINDTQAAYFAEVNKVT